MVKVIGSITPKRVQASLSGPERLTGLMRQVQVPMTVTAARQRLLDASPSDPSAQAASDVLAANAPSAITTEASRLALLADSPSDRAAQAAADALAANVPSDIATQAALDVLYEAELLAGIHQLDAAIDFGTAPGAVTPMFRYKAQDAGSESWPAWGYGGNLVRTTGAGSTLGQAGPFSGPLDGHLTPGPTGTTGVVFAASENVTGDVTTEDMIIELLLYYAGTAQRGVMAKRQTGSTVGYGLQFAGSPNCTLSLRSPTVVASLSATLRQGWNHLFMGINREGVGSGSGLCLTNGVTSGAVNLSSLGGHTLTAPQPLTLFRFASAADGTQRLDQPFSYVSAWKAPSGWIPDDATDTGPLKSLGAARFAALVQFPVGS